MNQIATDWSLVRHRLSAVARVLALAATAACAGAIPAAAQGLDPDPIRRPRPSGFPDIDASIDAAYTRLMLRRTAEDMLRSSPDDPATVAWLVEAGRNDDALDVLQRIVETRPEQIGPAFRHIAMSGQRMISDRVSEHRARLTRLLVMARKAVATLEREAQADSAFALLGTEHALADTYVEFSTRLRQLIAAYPGTAAAARARVQLLVDPRETVRTIAALDDVVDSSPGTTLAAMALHTKGSHIANRTFDYRTNRRADDHAGRLEQVVAIVRELGSGRYPPSYWVRHAPDLVFLVDMADVTMLDDHLPAADADRALAAYCSFFETHWALLDDEDRSSSARHTLSITMPLLAGSASAAPTAVDDLFASLEARGLPRASSLRLQALHHLFQERQGRSPEIRTQSGERLREILRKAAGSGSERDAREALVMLAAYELTHERFDEAHRHYRTFLERYPSNDWAWVAALRVAQLDEMAGSSLDTASAFEKAAAMSTEWPWARQLGSAYAARAFESAGLFDRALVLYRETLQAWPDPTERTLSVGWPPRRRAGSGTALPEPDRWVVNRDDVVTRVEQLSRSLTEGGGSELERGRSLLARARFAESRATFDGIRTAYPGSAVAVEALALSHQTRLEVALALAAADAPARDVSAAIAELEALEREPFDASVGLAGIARASLLRITGRPEEATRVLRSILTRWAASGTAAKDAVVPAPGSIEHDVLAIRDAVFLPMGGGIYGRTRRDTFEWPAQPPAFVMAPATLRVGVAGQPGETLVPVARAPAGMANVVFMSDDAHTALQRLPTQLGGTGRRSPQGVMDVPHQPVGDSSAIVRFWNETFFARHGHWGGWLTHTPPSFRAIQFTNAERTRAAVLVRFVYSGTTVIVEKEGGVWVAKELSGLWIE